MHDIDRDQTDRAAAEFGRLVRLMQILRSPTGCPWDREQTLTSLAPYVLEEAYEVLEAIEQQDHDALRDEIGDLVFEGVFLAQLCAEEQRFTAADAVASVVDKLLRRHPHVFPDGRLPEEGAQGSRLGTSAAVVEQWEQIKARERDASGRPAGVLSGIPKTMPALLRAYRIGRRVEAVGFDWPDAAAVLAKIDEELAELRGALASQSTDRVAEELGDLLFTVANLARKLEIDPEAALRKANDKFTARFGRLEAGLAARGTALGDAGLDAMEAEWARVKQEE